jgi:hypothetical protein
MHRQIAIASIMNPLISIPREALAELLRASGSPLTPEQYLASLPESGAFKKYPGRAWAAAVNKYCILVVAILSVVLLPFLGFDVENLIIVAGLATVTFFEFRVHRYFCENNPQAPSLGYRNQSCFAAAILIYCLYHAFFTFQLPVQDMNLVEENNLIDPGSLKSLARIFYLGIAIVAGGSQYGLACYYRSAQIRTKA